MKSKIHTRSLTLFVPTAPRISPVTREGEELMPRAAAARGENWSLGCSVFSSNSYLNPNDAFSIPEDGNTLLPGKTKPGAIRGFCSSAAPFQALDLGGASTLWAIKPASKQGTFYFLGVYLKLFKLIIIWHLVSFTPLSLFSTSFLALG